MRKFYSCTLLVMLLSVFAVSTASAQKRDNVRNRLKWDRLAAPSNADGEIEKVYFGYTRPDGKHFNLVADLSFPVASDQFTGGDIKEIDINFDGIPDLMISLGSVNGIGDFIYEGYVWDSQTRRFQLIKHFRDIINPEIEPDKNRIMSYDLHDDVDEVWEWKWKNGKLVKTDYYYQEKDVRQPTEEEARKQIESLAGKWKWVDDDEFSSDFPLVLSFSSDYGYLELNECTINGSTLAFGLFDIDCSYFNRQLSLNNTPYYKGKVVSFQIYSRLYLTPEGDLIGTFTYSAGEQNSQGTVTLRKLKE